MTVLNLVRLPSAKDLHISTSATVETESETVYHGSISPIIPITGPESVSAIARAYEDVQATCAKGAYQMLYARLVRGFASQPRQLAVKRQDLRAYIRFSTRGQRRLLVEFWKDFSTFLRLLQQQGKPMPVSAFVVCYEKQCATAIQLFWAEGKAGTPRVTLVPSANDLANSISFPTPFAPANNKYSLDFYGRHCDDYRQALAEVRKRFGLHARKINVHPIRHPLLRAKHCHSFQETIELGRHLTSHPDPHVANLS
jgi:hypothetical protein